MCLKIKKTLKKNKLFCFFHSCTDTNYFFKKISGPRIQCTCDFELNKCLSTHSTTTYNTTQHNTTQHKQPGSRTLRFPKLHYNKLDQSQDIVTGDAYVRFLLSTHTPGCS